MKKIKSTKRLNLDRETLLSLAQLTGAVGGGTFSPPSKPNASCFINCISNGCPTHEPCEVGSGNGRC
ncbi:MAG: hypothetical protein ABIY55_23745 [Kofleriaceae bacterium]